eukprot:TRINITY_DN80746_c0_g1_i1.p1 TRINITY_DN80746_c0_g1~~TRINITY_DN80746_c0_g1_i1.p1  ORF type:complete len:255 (+),score=52.60 TRINITY_DN80746_c0_g1_i1:78-842(+)
MAVMRISEPHCSGNEDHENVLCCDGEDLPVKNTFIHFDEQKTTGTRGRALRRCSTDPNDRAMLVLPPRLSPKLVEDELKEEEEERQQNSRSTSPCSRVGSSTDSSTTGPSSPGGGDATPQTPLFGTPPCWAHPNWYPYEPQMNLLTSSPVQVQQVESFTFTLRLAPGFELGLDWVRGRSGELLVDSVAPGSALDSWNKMQDPNSNTGDRSVHPGYQVLSVNDKTAVEAMIEELKSKYLLKLEMIRGNPLNELAF